MKNTKIVNIYTCFLEEKEKKYLHSKHFSKEPDEFFKILSVHIMFIRNVNYRTIRT